MSAPKRLCLAAPKYCGRGIEIRILTSPDKDNARLRAAQEVAAEITQSSEPGAQFVDNLKFQTAALRECAIEMVRKVTKKGGYKSLDEVVALPASEWQDCDSDTFATVFGANSRDEEVINNVYARFHAVSQADIDDIVGKAVDVSEG